MTTSKPLTPPDRSRRRRRKVEDDVDGRVQIIDAAIASILEVGFYRSSTNEIARRANVSWGALQYHFGTREALLLAIVKELDRRFVVDMESADVVGDTAEERVASLYEILARHYDDPAALVRLQILLNLQHDPDTSADVVAEVAEILAQGGVHVRRLLRATIGGRPSKPQVDALFNALRGFALSRQLARAVPIDGAGVPSGEAVKLFIRGVAAQLGEHPDE